MPGVKISPYRASSELRFGTRTVDWKPTLITYQLTPEELEAYKKGEKTIDEILKEREEEMKKINLTVEEYVESKNLGMSDREIAEAKGLTSKQLENWKYHRKTKIEEYKNSLNNAQNSDDIKNEYKTTADEIKNEIKAILAELEHIKRENECLELAIEELKKENEILQEEKEKLKTDSDALFNENERLKKEVIDAHKLVTEREKEVEEWKTQAGLYKDLYNDSLDRREKMLDEYKALQQELKGLRIYALQKLLKEVKGA